MHRGPICGKQLTFIMKGDAAMLKRLSALPILTFILLILPLQAIAQQPTQPPAPPQDYYWHGPWHQMWGDGYGWHFWWMFPLMMLCMMSASGEHRGAVTLVARSDGAGWGWLCGSRRAQ
jgi:hypothetical protein